MIPYNYIQEDWKTALCVRLWKAGFKRNINNYKTPFQIFALPWSDLFLEWNTELSQEL